MKPRILLLSLLAVKMKRLLSISATAAGNARVIWTILLPGGAALRWSARVMQQSQRHTR